MMPSFDDDNNIIDLTFVRSASEQPENQTYICSICRDGPDSILFEVTDPEKLKFIGTDKLYCCPTCGWTWLSSDPMIRRQEKVQTIIPPLNKPNSPIFETVKSYTSDKLRGTDHSKEIDFNLHPGDLEQLRHEGLQLKSETVKSSVSGRSYITAGRLRINRFVTVNRIDRQVMGVVAESWCLQCVKSTK